MGGGKEKHGRRERGRGGYRTRAANAHQSARRGVRSEGREARRERDPSGFSMLINQCDNQPAGSGNAARGGLRTGRASADRTGRIVIDPQSERFQLFFLGKHVGLGTER
eukprot:625134-Rhodomonas_salina.2